MTLTTSPVEKLPRDQRSTRPQQGGLHRDKCETLKKTRRVVPVPVKARGLPPLPRQTRERHVLARLGGEILHDLISRERIRESRAQRRVEPCCACPAGAIQ